MYTVNEVVDLLMDDEELNNGEASVYIMPPDTVGVETDEDSADEDQPPTIANLSGRQLRARGLATVRTKSGRQFIGENLDSESDSASDSNEKTKPTQSKKKKKERHWVRRDNNVQPSIFCAKNWIEEIDMQPSSLFELFFDEEVVAHTLEMSNLYAQQNGKDNFVLTESELKLAIAILIISGYSSLPRRRLYWENSEDTFNAAIANSMSVNRFEEILRYLHFADNYKLNQDDKLAKVRPLFSMLNEKFVKYWVPEENLDVDESMAPYYGHHGAKQFIRGKPIRYGFKVWCLNTPNGYLVQMEPYQGAGTVQMRPNLGMGGSVVMELASVLSDTGLSDSLTPEQHFSIYFDNLFTSPALLTELKKEGFDGTGTLRANRTESCPLESVDSMKKKPRGTTDFRLDTDDNILLVRWNDNNVVTVASTKHGVAPMKNVQRFSQSEKKFIQVPCPDAIMHYNKAMGGTDRMDQNVANYRVSMRKKKWWWPLFVFCLGTSTHNAWCLYRKSAAAQHEPLDYLGFLRKLALTYVHKYRGVKDNAGRPGRMELSVVEEVRQAQGGHYLISWPTQRRCRQCKGNTKKACSKCPATPLHEKCFEAFHSK